MDEKQKAKCDQIANVLRKHIPHSLGQHLFSNRFMYGQWFPLPTQEQFAEALLGDAEFRSLQLGTWLGTTDGKLLTEAVGLVISPTYAPEFAVAVEGLKLAAQLQHEEGTQKAGTISAGVLALVAVVLAAFSFVGRAQ